jgi:hypothetical protein
MNNPIQLTDTIPTVRTSVSRSLLRRGFLLIPLAIAMAGLALSPTARAVDPPPDGGYPNGNTAEGEDALFELTTGSNNTGIGFDALYSDTIGVGNTATGGNALFTNTIGSANTASGANALYSNTTGSSNTASGADALYFNTTGYGNTANGIGALYYNTTGLVNTAAGNYALYSNTTGSSNTASGANALYFNTTGDNNTCNGIAALYMNTTGSGNTANGLSALVSNTTGYNNTASGVEALSHKTTGHNNIAIGNLAGTYLTTGSNNIDIGAVGGVGESNTMRLGRYGIQNRTFIAGVSGATVPGGVTVIVDSLGHLGTITSSARYKDNIKPMDKASEAILALQPVTFHYKKELDPRAIPQFGLVAEQVAKVDPDLVARDEEGKPYTVRYEAVNAMLLNEFLKEHRKVEALEATVAAQQKGFESKIEALTAALKAQAAQIQNVSDQLRTQALAPRVVAND